MGGWVPITRIALSSLLCYSLAHERWSLVGSRKRSRERWEGEFLD